MQPTNQDRIITLTIHYTNGKQQHFEFIPQEISVGEQANLGTRLHKLLTADPIIIELADKLLVIPVHNIQSIEISSVPPKLSEGVIHTMLDISKWLNCFDLKQLIVVRDRSIAPKEFYLKPIYKFKTGELN